MGSLGKQCLVKELMSGLVSGEIQGFRKNSLSF